MAVSAPFRVGMREIYLPNFIVTLRRHPTNPPDFASFVVPLWFSKLDLKDYLYHAYSVRIGPTIRSYVKQSRIRQGQVAEPSRPQYKRWHRPRSKKFMTVELERPFVWPEEPTDFSAWNKEEVKASKEEQEESQSEMGGMADTIAASVERRQSIREQAQALLDGRERWRPGSNKTGGTR